MAGEHTKTVRLRKGEGASGSHTKTVRIRETRKVGPDERGRSVWLGKVEPVELELVSTTALQKILKSGDGKERAEIRRLAAGRKDGVLAREAGTGHFRILGEAELRKAMDAPPAGGPTRRRADVVSRPLTETTLRAAQELSLASTQYLRKVVKPDAESAKPKVGRKDKFGGFNPYDNG